MMQVKEVEVLDKGFVRLVDILGDEMSIVRSARVSYNAVPRGGNEDVKLIEYMWNNGHSSPFEHVIFTFDVKAPLFVFRQWHRHRTWSYNEISARYTKLKDEFYVPLEHTITEQAAYNKQARTDQPIPNAQFAREKMLEACAQSYRQYEGLLDMGVPRELARSVLPVSVYSQMFATVDLHNLCGFLRQRLHPHAQWEIRQYAEAIVSLIAPHVPVTMDLLMNEVYDLE